MENKIFSDLNINCQERLTNDNENTTEDQTKSTNISSEDIDKEIINKLRGDAIGDTMYSQSSVIRILLQLSDMDWNQKLEEDLCLLWDMTVERDVCEYLYQLSFPSIATAIILKHTEPRLIEIIIGILGNMCSNNEIVPDITDIEISIVLNAMETDDHLILIQIMRFIIAVIYHRNSKLHFITADIVDKICFILSNSTNKDLLLYTMDALSKITGDFKIESELLNEEVLKSLLISYKFINTQSGKDKDEFDDETIEERKSTNFFVQIVLNICLYLNEGTSNDLHKQFSNKNNELVEEFRIIIHKCSVEDLVPLSEDIIFYFESFTIIFPVLNVKYDSNIFLNVFNMINVLSKAHEDKIEACIELIRYIISVGDVNNMIKDIENVNCDKANVFKFILEHKSKCDFNFNNNIVSIIEKIEDNAK